MSSIKKPIERYAEMVQLLPASESHHHSHLGGMLDHGLEVLSFSAKLRQSYVLPQMLLRKNNLSNVMLGLLLLFMPHWFMTLVKLLLI